MLPLASLSATFSRSPCAACLVCALQLFLRGYVEAVFGVESLQHAQAMVDTAPHRPFSQFEDQQDPRILPIMLGLFSHGLWPDFYARSSPADLKTLRNWKLWAEDLAPKAAAASSFSSSSSSSA